MGGMYLHHFLVIPKRVLTPWSFFAPSNSWRLPFCLLLPKNRSIRAANSWARCSSCSSNRRLYSFMVSACQRCSDPRRWRRGVSCRSLLVELLPCPHLGRIFWFLGRVLASLQFPNSFPPQTSQVVIWYGTPQKTCQELEDFPQKTCGTGASFSVASFFAMLRRRWSWNASWLGGTNQLKPR